MKRWSLAVVLALAVVTAVAAGGCTPPTAATTTGGSTSLSGAATIGALTSGTWASLAYDPVPGNVALPIYSCGNFGWTIITLSKVRASGAFTAECGGGILLTGNATVALSGTDASWGAAGTTTGPGIFCTFDLAGTAVMETGGVRITYTGKYCTNTIQGQELLEKKK